MGTEFRRRLDSDGKYKGKESFKPGTQRPDQCLHDPPRMPPDTEPIKKRAALPTRKKDGRFRFSDFPEFTPNLSPAQVLRRGAFGGTYYRDIKSSVTGVHYKGREVIAEFPTEWFDGVDIATKVCSPTYRLAVNKYQASCGASLGQWESSGWIAAQDPYGWFQWYCRFFLGRRSSDDERQIKRWLNGQGPRGRFWVRLTNERGNKVLNQVALHWANELPGRSEEGQKRKNSDTQEKPATKRTRSK